MDKVISIIGTTSCGKSDFAVELAKVFNGEIISADSRQVYKGLDLTTGKIMPHEMQGIKHYLLDIIEVNNQYTLFKFQQDCYQAIEKILLAKKLPIICGGTGLYTRSIAEGFNLTSFTANEKYRNELNNLDIKSLQGIIKQKEIEVTQTDFENKRRLVRAIENSLSNVEKVANEPKYDILQICLFVDRSKLRERIKERLKMRIENGMIDEIKNMLSNGASREFLESLGQEFKHTVYYLDGKYKNFEEYFEKLNSAICQFAKRQQTWFKKEKDAIYLDALDPSSLKQAKLLIQEFLINKQK